MSSAHEAWENRSIKRKDRRGPFSKANCELHACADDLDSEASMRSERTESIQATVEQASPYTSIHIFHFLTNILDSHSPLAFLR
jgi:hypothetical protein